jgi:hypothetical protein
MASLVPVAAYNRHFIVLWIQADRYGGDWVTVLATVNALVMALVSLWGWVFSGTGHIFRLMPLLLASTALNVAVSIVATRNFGLPGPLLGTTVAIGGVMLWGLPWQLERVFGTSPGRLLRAAAVPIALGMPYAGLLWWIAAVHQPWGWTGLASEMALAGGLYLLLAWWTVLDREHRAFWRDRARLALGLQITVEVTDDRTWRRLKPTSLDRTEVSCPGPERR